MNHNERETMRSRAVLRLFVLRGVALFLLLVAPEALSAEIRILAPGSLRPVFVAVADEFQRNTGHTLSATYGSAGEITKRLETGDATDLAVIPTGVVAPLLEKGRIVAGSSVEIARVKVGIGIRAGNPKIDISSAEGLKRALLAANSITYTDPSRGGSAGVHFAKVLQRLGIEAEMKSKTTFAEGGVAYLLAKGQADIGITQMSELVGIAGVDALGPLPSGLDHTSSFSAAVVSGAKEPEAAKALITFLSSPAAAAVLKAKGMEPSNTSSK